MKLQTVGVVLGLSEVVVFVLIVSFLVVAWEYATFDVNIFVFMLLCDGESLFEDVSVSQSDLTW